MKGMKRFDLYRKVPRDLTEPTLSGAAVSCFTVSLALYLFCAEFIVFMRRTWDSEMLIDESNTEEKLQINLDITFPSLPCEMLSFDAQDVMGSHEVDAHGHLYKERMTSKGDVIAKEEMKTSHYGASSGLTRHFSFSYENEDVEKIKQMVHSGEGCRVFGHVKVNRVPGNVHLSTYSHSYLFGSLYQETRNLNVTHTINHISFGVDADIGYIKEHFKDTGIVAPLDGLTQIMPARTDGKYDDSAIYEYYTKVVPTTYVPLDRPSLSVFQFTANSNRIANQQMPSLYLRYDFSPVTVIYKERRESASHFLVQICAVVGGLFSVAGLFDALIHRGIVHIAQKAQIGKLG